MNYLGAHEEILVQLEELMRRSRPFEKLYKEFEAKLICYLPLNTFLLKPAQRLLHYRLILERKYLEALYTLNYLIIKS